MRARFANPRPRPGLLVLLISLACAAALALSLIFGALNPSALPAQPADVHITPDGLAPGVFTATLGSPVVWINQTAAAVRLAPGPLLRHHLPLILRGAGPARGRVGAPAPSPAPDDGAFGAVLAPGEAYTHTFPTAGTYPYHAADPTSGILHAGEVRVVEPPPPTPQHLTYHIVHEYPHDPQAFTQGLVFDDGHLYEGTGLHGRSSLRRVDLATGQVLQIRELADDYFGEGIAVFDEDRIAQLTLWSGIGFVYDQEDFQPLQDFHYETEGWGLTYDGEQLIMSDGTATLHLLDPHTFEEQGTVEVRDPEGPVYLLNELEYVAGELYANVWFSDNIAVIDLETGWVTAWIDLSGLLSPAQAAEADVLNGIAYDAAADRLFVTGKLWPTLFEICLVPLQGRRPTTHTPQPAPGTAP